MSRLDEVAEGALEHIRYLSVVIGGRGSCTPQERLAAEYTAERMRGMGVAEVRLEAYKGSPSTYRPYALALGAAVLATLLMWLIESPWMLAAVSLANALAAWGMLAESDLAANWMRWVLSKGESQNAVGIIAPAGQVQRRVVLSAHVDTHRTPSFYASKERFTRFRLLMSGAWLAMIVEAILYGLAAVFGWGWVFWFGALALLQVAALDLCLAADRTPFSPGANDNASGVGAVLALAQRLMAEPLARTEVWLAFTGCGETAAYGMAAFLKAHGSEDGSGEPLGEEAIYVIVDMVGQGRLMQPTADGLLIRHKVHPAALELSRGAAAALPGLEVTEQVGLAYTDATLATKKGRIALRVNMLPPPGEEERTQWHRMSDTLERVDPQALTEALTYTWQLLQEVDRAC